MSTSFGTLRGLVARQIEPGGFYRGVTTSSGPAGVVTCSTFTMNGGDTRALDGGWLYFVDGTLIGQERAIAEAGLAVAGGDISVGNAYSTTTPSGATFEVHLRYPVTDGPGGTPWVTGTRSMLNDSLSLLWFEDYLSVSGVSNQARYLLPISTYDWLADQPNLRIMDVVGPADPTSNVRRSSPYSWRVEADDEAPALIFTSGGYNTGDTFYLKVARPANSRIQVGGIWTDVSDAAPNNGVVGLYADTDRCHALATHVQAMAITESMNRLGMRQPAMDKAVWEDRRRYWRSVAAGIKQRRLPRPDHQDFRPTIIGSGRRRGLGRGY